MKLTTAIGQMVASVTDVAPALPATLAGVVDVLGGSLAASKVLGYNPPAGDKKAESNARRVVERYVNREEHGKTKSNRQIGAEDREKLDAAAQEKLDAQQAQLDAEGREKIAENGVFIQGEVNLLDPSGRPITRYLDIEIDGDELEEFLDALEEGDEAGAAEAFDVAAMNAYGFGSTGRHGGAHFDAGGSAIPAGVSFGIRS